MLIYVSNDSQYRYMTIITANWDDSHMPFLAKSLSTVNYEISMTIGAWPVGITAQ